MYFNFLFIEMRRLIAYLGLGACLGAVVRPTYGDITIFSNAR